MYSVLVYLRYKLKVSNVRFDKILYHQLDIQVKKTNNSRLLQGWSSIKHKTKNNNINPVCPSFCERQWYGKCHNSNNFEERAAPASFTQ